MTGIPERTYISALREELEENDDAERVAAIEAELARLGAQFKTAKRTTASPGPSNTR